MLKLASLQPVTPAGTKAVAAMLFVQVCVVGVAAAQPAGSARALEGIWDSTVSPKDCASGAALGPPFKALIVFRRGGTFDVDAMQGASPSGDVYGLWTRVGGTAYTANAVHLRYNPDGTYAGMNKVRRDLTLAGDGGSFTSALTVRVLDIDGNLLGEVCPTEAAVRIVF
jgi:hypothetical protein